MRIAGPKTALLTLSARELNIQFDVANDSKQTFVIPPLFAPNADIVLTDSEGILVSAEGFSTVNNKPLSSANMQTIPPSKSLRYTFRCACLPLDQKTTSLLWGAAIFKLPLGDYTLKVVLKKFNPEMLIMHKAQLIKAGNVYDSSFLAKEDVSSNDIILRVR